MFRTSRGSTDDSRKSGERFGQAAMFRSRTNSRARREEAKKKLFSVAGFLLGKLATL